MRLCRLCLVTCLNIAWPALPVAAAEQRLMFETDIRPLLAEKCGKCHSEEVRKGGLDLSSMAGLRRGGESGEPLIATTLDESLLWQLIDADEMPPADEPRISEEERGQIRRWIAGGAHATEQAADAPIHQHQILPIMLLRCTACHGPQRQFGGLDLRTVAGMRAGGNHGPAIIPGDADASPLLQRIISQQCPPGDQLLKFFVRRPPTAEVEMLRRWIESGAPEIEMPADIATTEPDRLVTDQDRGHWAFQPLQGVPLSGSIDEFIARRLASAGLDFSAQADRDTLIRRVHIDLTGMPPDWNEYRRLRDSNDPLWYPAMVDRLLDSPYYGQRWGRHWLDLAGYADSEGGVSADPLRPVAWKYRDYVINAFNSDKPYDRFLLEQLAGDELQDYQNVSEVTDEMVQNLVATGFLRMGIDETGSRTMNFVPERLKVISDAINVVSAGLMGLTMECARCHSHKYDPIPHRDYYRFKAIFQGALDEHDWYSFKTRTVNVATTAHQQLAARVNPPLEKQIKRLRSQIQQTTRSIQLQLLRRHYPDQSESDNLATLAALKIADNNRTLEQRTLVERLQQAELVADQAQPSAVIADRDRLRQLVLRVDRLQRQMVPSLAIRALCDQGRPSPTYVLRRGEHDRPGDLVGPGVPSVLTDGKTPFVVIPPFPEGTAKTGRRLALARWLTRPDHPLTARVMVNRIWYLHFGRGLVKELDNFGTQSSPPSHPQLLDWLAQEFVRGGWSIKRLHRMMLNSRAYRQVSRVGHRQQQLDPDNRLWSRMPLRRLDAESLRDSLLRVAGRLDDTPGGLPDTVSVDRDGLVSVNPTSGGGWRRSVYLQYRRTEIPTLMAAFDYPSMGPNCIRRNVSNISPQALMLTNNGHVRELAAALADRVRTTVVGAATSDQDDDATAVETLYQMLLCRLPSPAERRLGIEALQSFRSGWRQQPDRALETYCHTIINSAAFLYVD